MESVEFKTTCERMIDVAERKLSLLTEVEATSEFTSTYHIVKLPATDLRRGLRGRSV